MEFDDYDFWPECEGCGMHPLDCICGNYSFDSAETRVEDMKDALVAWVKANPWSATVAVGLAAGFAALAIWLAFNAVFG